jgi:hypothetical protein
MRRAGQSHRSKHTERKKSRTDLAAKHGPESHEGHQVKRRRRQKPELLIEEEAQDAQRDHIQEDTLAAVRSKRIWISKKNRKKDDERKNPYR